jgi:hypothetical protein
MFTDGQQILVPDFNSVSGTWGVQTVTVRVGEGDNRYHLERESGDTLWGVSERDIQELMDSADRRIM